MTTIILDVILEKFTTEQKVSYVVTSKRVKRKINSTGFYILETAQKIITPPENSFALEPTALGEAWIISMNSNGDNFTGYFKVPSQESVKFSQLVEVDPKTLETDSKPDPEWWAVANSTINNAEIVGGELVFTRNDGVKINVGEVIGEPGKQGEPGSNGSNGANGLSITGAFITPDGDLELTRSDGMVYQPGHVVGSDGVDGAVLAGDDNVYTIDKSVGTVVNLWDSSLSKQQEVFSDTGVRDITSLWDGGAGGGSVTLVRRNGYVELSIYANTFTSSTIKLNPLPLGFRPPSNRLIRRPFYGGTNSAERILIYASGRIDLLNGTSGALMYGSIIWPTNDPYPTTLPGI